MARPTWVDDRLFPFESRFAEVDGATVHYVDEGEGPPLLLLHGNPTWSFLYRHLIHGLRDRFRCIAVDYPGFGLSTAPPGYGYTVAEHARVLEGLVTSTLDLRDVTMMVQDWGGPIGLAVAVRHPDRYAGLVIGNTWGWPLQGDPSVQMFSRFLTSAPGRFLVYRADLFTTVFLRVAMRRRLSRQERAMYRAPHPTPASRLPVAVMPGELLAARPLMEEVERGLPRLAHLPALIVWGARDPAFRPRFRRRWESLLPNHRTVVLRDASHYLQEDAPEEIAAAIRSWADDRGAAPAS